MSAPVKTMSNGISSNADDRHAAIDYLKRLKAGEKAERPTIHDGRMVDEIGQAEHMVTMAGAISQSSHSCTRA